VSHQLNMQTTNFELPLFKELVDAINRMKSDGEHIPSLNEMIPKLKKLDHKSTELILAIIYYFDESKACLPIPYRGRYDSGSPNKTISCLVNTSSVSFSIPQLPQELKELITVFLMGI
jgi:hypothetical protein